MSQQWNPLQDLMHLQDRMNRLFEDATQRRVRSESKAGDPVERADWTPDADIYEAEENYSVAMDLPGIDRTALEINVDESHLIVKGTRLLAEPPQQVCERPRGRFLRTFTIPGSVDTAAISAEFKDGVLQITLPRRKEQKAQRVKIKIS